MKVRRVSLLAVSVLLLASCGSGGGSTAAKTYTPAQLDKVLLTAGEAGEGWTQKAHNVPTTTPETVPGPTTTVVSEFCPASGGKLAEFERLTSDERAVMVMLQAPQGTDERPVGVIEKMWSFDNASKLFADVKAALPACVGQSWQSPSSGELLTLTSVTGLPKVGDESISVLVTATEPSQSGDIEWYMPTTIARHGSAIIVLEGLDIHSKGAAPTLTVAQLSPIFTTAAAKIQALPK
jgi:hypothetical protein